MNNAVDLKILTATIAANALPVEKSQSLTRTLAKQTDVVVIASQFDSPKLKRELNLAKRNQNTDCSLELEFRGNEVIYRGHIIGKVQILYKSPLPGELQARLTNESATDRYVEYLQRRYQIVVLDESDRHVRVFIPNNQIPSFAELWEEFLRNVAFSAYGDTKHQLPGLVQTFIQMLNSVTLSGRGFSTLDVPVMTKDQALVLAAWYFAVVRDVKKRQEKRQRDINDLENELADSDLDEKKAKAKLKDLHDKQAMQLKEAEKYTEYFKKSFGQSLEEGNALWQEIKQLEVELAKPSLKLPEKRKLEKQLEKLRSKLVFGEENLQYRLDLFAKAEGDPFKFVELNEKENPEQFQDIRRIAKNFSKTATDQINSTRGDIFTQCISEMYRLMDLVVAGNYEQLPQSLLTEELVFSEARSPGDDSKEFCYSCGMKLDPKNARWQVLRFMFERPSQRRQSASSEGRPYICASCSGLAFASPLKVTEESIIIQLKAFGSSLANEIKIKDYLRMLTNKQMHLSSGRYLILTSDRTNTGDLASEKIGQVQYAIAKVASIFPMEVLGDFQFLLIPQGSQEINLHSRHLIFIKGLMDGYGQQIINAGKEINMTLGDAVRYIQQDLPYLAEYTLTKIAHMFDRLHLEKIRERYWKEIEKYLETKGVSMGSENQLAKRAKLYKDVASLTGLTYAFADSLEKTAKKVNDKEYTEREVSKLIEKVDDAVAFCYYATLGDENKTSVQARLYKNPDNYFIYEQAKKLLENLGIANREEKDNSAKFYLTFYADDVLRIYTHFAEGDYIQPKDWNELTYQLKLSLYTRFPELVRKQKSTNEK